MRNVVPATTMPCRVFMFPPTPRGNRAQRLQSTWADGGARYRTRRPSHGSSTRFHHMIAPVTNVAAGANPNSAQTAFVV